jgi:hypothetical protein
MFIRRAQSAEHLDSWVFWVQGGSSCSSYESCYDRWCGTEYHAGKMSSTFTEEGALAKGIFRRSGSNTSCDYEPKHGAGNQVYLYYCSSDSWSGRKNDSVLTDPDTGGQYRLHFRGRSIMEAAFQELLGGTMSDDGTEELPPLSDATNVLLTASSAGASGLTRNLDWIRSQLPASAQVAAVFDATFNPIMDVMTPEIATAYDAAIEGDHEAKVALFDPYTDESCAKAHADEPHRCNEISHIRSHHLGVPYFQIMDITDPKMVGIFKSVAGLSGIPLESSEIANWQRDTMLGLSDVPTDAEEPLLDRAPGVFSQLCGKHTALQDDEWFYCATMKGPDGTPRSMNDALAAWLAGPDIALIDTITPALSFCPAE